MVQLLMRILLLSLMVFLSGCIYVPPVWDVGDEIYHLDFIKPGMTTKDQVLAELGEPDGSYELPTGTRFVYTGHKSGGFIAGMYYGGGEIAPSDWTVTIAFDENDVVSAIFGIPEPRAPVAVR